MSSNNVAAPERCDERCPVIRDCRKALGASALRQIEQGQPAIEPDMEWAVSTIDSYPEHCQGPVLRASGFWDCDSHELDR